MSDFTVAELETKLEESQDELFGGDEPWYAIGALQGYGGKPNKTIELPGFGTLEFVEDFGGEGMGDSQWIVFKVGDRLFRKEGYYDSWNGGEWDGDFEEVEAREVVEIQYFAKETK